MKRKKPKSIPIATSCKPAMELSPVAVAVSCKTETAPKFLPPVTLSYESTLELKPIPANEHTGGVGEGAVRGTPKKKTRKKRIDKESQ